MTHVRGERAILYAVTQDQFHDQVLDCVYSEFLETPGLRLTCRQAQRLWGLDEQTCVAVLTLLVNTSFLSQPSHSTYGRASDERDDVASGSDSQGYRGPSYLRSSR